MKPVLEGFDRANNKLKVKAAETKITLYAKAEFCNIL
jgi:hypothetical protein